MTLIKYSTAADKAAFFVLLAALVVIITIFNISIAHAIGLKENSVVSGDNITLGDVFYDLPGNESRVLGPAPRPGKEIVLNARTLLRIAVAMDLSWRPSSATDYVVLTRDGTVIGRDDVKDAIKTSMRAKGITGKYDLHISNGLNDIVLPPDLPASVDIADLEVKMQKNWFQATILAPSKDNPIVRQRVSGSFDRLIDVPVATDALRNGTIIGQRDIQMIEIREQDLNHDTILNPEELFGMTPRRMVSPGLPINANDIEAPIIVQRGEFVTMHFTSGPLQLTASGKAMENGAKGDVIRVTNTTSSKTVEAQVTNTKEVTVRTF